MQLHRAALVTPPDQALARRWRADVDDEAAAFVGLGAASRHPALQPARVALAQIALGVPFTVVVSIGMQSSSSSTY